MATLPPRKNPTPTKISRQHLTPLQILLQMGFPKHRAEKALAATGNRGVQLASDWLLAHVNDPLLDDNSPREYIFYACPTGIFLEQLQDFWNKSLQLCGWNGAHNYTPHITLTSFFKAADEYAPHLAQSLKAVMERPGALLNEPLKLEMYTSPNFMGFFVAEEHADYLKRIAMQYVKEVSNATVSLEPHVKDLHLSLAYQFPSAHYSNLKALVDVLDPNSSAGWELRLYSRDPRISGKQIHKVIHSYNPQECDELELRIGDFVYISSEALSNSVDGWVEGTSWLTGCTGLLPASYTERTAEMDAWTLHKKISLTTQEVTDQSVPSPALSEEQRNQVNASPQPSSTSDEIALSPYPPSTVAELPLNVDDVEDTLKTELTIKDNTYENVENLKYDDTNATSTLQESHKPRKLFLMRHGERVDFTFGNWIPYCYDEDGNYVRKDLNMPETLPRRSDGPRGYLKDSPLTNIGIFQATTTGMALKERNVEIHHVYCSPSFRCIQTCDAVLRGMNKRDELKIKIEPGLFEWLVWYPDALPMWVPPEELKEFGYNIDTEYQPYLSAKQLKESNENCEQFYLRSHFISQSVLNANASGNILFVGHAATLEVCSRELVGGKRRMSNEMTKVIQKVPYCGLLELSECGDKWEITPPPCLPLTHTTNQRFDWKLLTY